jgi:hypothetical protein
MSSAFHSVGIKGSDVFSSTGDPRLDLSVKCVRGADKTQLQEALFSVLALGTPEAIEDAFVLAFHARNIRGGKGEKDVFYALFQKLYAEMPNITSALLDLVPYYGCWVDLFRLVSDSSPSDFRQAVVDLVAKQLLDDVASTTGTISLLAKWVPREGAHRFLSTRIAQAIAYKLFPHVLSHSGKMRRYRQLISDLNKQLKTVETFMCSDRWNEIQPASVPGRAGKLYGRAFLNLPTTYHGEGETSPTSMFRHPEDEKRMECRKHFEEHFAKAAKGEAKIHGADTLFPHEIVKKAVMMDPRPRWTYTPVSLAEMYQLCGIWRGMVEKAKATSGLGRSIFMSDFSGSMLSSSVGDTPYWVSMAIGMLGAEVCGGEFNDRLMTFDSNPTWHHFRPGSDLFERIRTIQDSRIGQGTSTDFQKAMDLVLQTLKEKRVRPGQEPENLIVLTDMNFDAACSSSQHSYYTGHYYRHVVKTAPWQTHIAMIQEAFKRAGEDMWGPGNGFVVPRIVIWNLAASQQTDFHATADTPGVTMLSGWSAAQFEILQKEGPRQMTAYEVLRLELDDPKYQRVRDRLRSLMA